MAVQLPEHMRRSNADTVRDECAPYRGMSFEERARELALVCRDVPAMLARYTAEHRARMHAADDRLPESTTLALARLRKQFRGLP